MYLHIGNGNNIGRLDTASQTGFTDQGLKGHISHSSHTVGTQKFQGVFTFKEIVFRQIDLAHAACADTAFQGVVSQDIIPRQIRVGKIIPRILRSGEQYLSAAMGTLGTVAEHPEFALKISVT